MTVQHADENPGGSLETSREELLGRARPFPTYEEMLIEELTDREADAFWSAMGPAWAYNAVVDAVR